MLHPTLQLCLLLLYSLSSTDTLKYTEIKSGHSGLVFVKTTDAKISYDTYTILYHIDLSTYFKIATTIKKYSNIAEKNCYKLNSTTCNVVIKSIKNQLEYIHRDEMDIRSYQQNQLKSNMNTHVRQKRSIESIGSAFHWMFGLMDADTAREYDNKINNIINETERIKFTSQDNTIFIKETIGHMNNTFATVHEQMEAINDKINSHQSRLEAWNIKLSALEIEAEILKTGIVLQNLITEHRASSSLLLKSLENAMSNKINQLIPSQKLALDLFSIYQILPMNQMLPINFTVENPLSIFKYSKTSASLFGKRYLLEITIPIIERQQYAAYEIIPIPTIVDNKALIINPSMKFVLINTGGSEYIPITKSELDISKTNFFGEKIISPSENSHLDISQSCEITIFLAPRKNIILDLCDVKIIPKTNYFISINHNNIFFVTITKPTTLIEHCSGKQIKSYDLHMSGKMLLEPGCRVSTDKISIRPRTNYKFNSQNEIILSNHTQNLSLEAFSIKIAHLKNITIPEMNKNIVIKDYSLDFQKLSSHAEKLIEQAKWESNIQEIHYENVNRSYFIYWLIGIAVTILIIAGIIFGLFIYLKFYNINTWIRLAEVLGTKNSDRVPKLFIENRPNAPYFNEL